MTSSKLYNCHRTIKKVAHTLEKRWGNKMQKLLEMVVIEAYRQGSISTGKVRELLYLSTRLEADAFLQENGIELEYDEADFDIAKLMNNYSSTGS